MKKEVLLSAILMVMAIAAMADEYTDPQTNVVYTYVPGQTTASVKAGFYELIGGNGHELGTIYHSGSPDATGHVVILDRFSVGTAEYVVTSIGEDAFRDNKNIKSVSIPETVNDIGGSAFSFCDNLTVVELPEGLTQIAPQLFRGCGQLESVVIPSSVKTIGNYAFDQCFSLTNLTLPASVISVGRYAFYKTSWYTSLYKEAPNGPFYIGSLLFGYKGDKPTGDLVIKDGTTCICYEAFLGCDGLTSVTIPKSIIFVDEDAFYNCTRLNAVHITDLSAWCGIDFKWGILQTSSNPLCYAHHLYLNGKEVTNLVIPEGVTRIGSYAFDNCTTLTSVTIPDGVTSIGTYTFRSCEQLKRVTIPPSLTEIGSCAFIWCFNLEAVHISDLAAWCGMTLLENAVNPLYYGAHLYLNEKEVTDIVIPEGVTCINNLIFENFAHLTSVTIPDGVTSIGEQAFYGCRKLTHVAFPRSLVSIGDRAFWRCSNIEKVTIPKGVTSIGEAAFSECSSLTSITIPEGVTSIGVGAFFRCHSLTSIVIPSSVSSIGQGAFFGCWPLTSVISQIEEPFEIADDVFESYDEKTYERYFTSATLYVPKGCKARYESTAGWKNFKEIVELPDQDDYHPFIEEGKVWKLGGRGSANPVQLVEYYYFDGDTIINGKTCKQMMCQRYVTPDYPDYEAFAKIPSLRNVGAWYEEDKKVYTYDTINKQFKIKYDFSLGDNETMQIEDYPYVIGPKQTGGLKGFKGVYRDVMWYSNDADPAYCTTWLEGVGGIDGPITNVYLGKEYYAMFMMSCTVGDEVIYLNDEYEDGATPEGARKKRFDFTHTVKIQPKSRFKSGERLRAGDAEASGMEQPLYGEYNDLQLGINLDPLDDAYQVRITNESGKAVYEKAVNAGSIVALSIDISSYAEGRYTVTVENNDESFTGEFDTETTGISDALRLNKNEERINNESIFDLQGQRISSLQKGLNIVNGQKVFVK